MESLHGKLLYFVVLLCISSCTSFKPIIKKSELTEDGLRKKIIPGKTYLFTLNSKEKLKVKVAEIDSVNLYGVVRNIRAGKYEWVSFKDSYSRLYMNSTMVEEKKFDPIKNLGLLILIASLGWVLQFRNGL